MDEVIQAQLDQIYASLEADTRAEITLYKVWQGELQQRMRTSPNYIAWLRCHTANLSRERELLLHMAKALHPTRVSDLPDRGSSVSGLGFPGEIEDTEWSRHLQSVCPQLFGSGHTEDPSSQQPRNTEGQPPADGTGGSP